jgi:hypothetical protein
MQIALHAYVLVGHVVHRHEDLQVARRTVQQLDEAHETGGGASGKKKQQNAQKTNTGTKNRGTLVSACFEAQRLRLLSVNTMLTF